MKNAQKPETIHLGKLLKEIKKGQYVIPDFQREFDWKPWDVRELVKSIFLDYYIGSLLLWETDRNNYKTLSCEPLFGYDGEMKPEYIVLDGQQRLTALHYVFFKPDIPFKGRKNKMYFFVDIEELAFGNEDTAYQYQSATKYYNKLIKSRQSQIDHCLFPLYVMGEGAYEIEKWFKDFDVAWHDEKELVASGGKEIEGEVDQYIERINNYLSTARELKESIEDLLDSYEISYVSLSRNIEIGKVCEIFTHINQRGVKLDTFDLLNAITYPKGIQLKQMYREASILLDDRNYPGIELKSYILMVMSILRQNYCSPKYLYYLVPNAVKKIKDDHGKIREITLIESDEEFVSLWNRAVRAIERGLASLKNPRDFGAIASKFLPYPSIIPALSAVKEFTREKQYPNKIGIQSKIKVWYWASILLNRYSSSVESTSTKDFLDLLAWFENPEKEPDIISEVFREYENLDLYREQRSGSAIYKAIFNLFILKGAKDLQTFDLPEYENLDDHHIVPKSWGKRNGMGNIINSILNRTPLSPNTNRYVIKDKLPNVYMKELIDNNSADKVRELLDTHLISKKAVKILMRDPFGEQDFMDFINERKKTIIKEIKNMLLSDVRELPKDLRKLDEQIENVELEIRRTIINVLNLEDEKDLPKHISNHILEKLKYRIEKERKNNPATINNNEHDVAFRFQYLDLQELNQIICAKNNWPAFENMFHSKEKLVIEFNDMANLRNSVRHSREVDEKAKMKGQASILWFKEQLDHVKDSKSQSIN